VGRCGLDECDSGWRTVTDYSEQGNGNKGYIKGGEFLD